VNPISGFADISLLQICLVAGVALPVTAPAH